MGEDLLNGISSRLELRGKRRRAVMRELRSHVEASVFELELCGRSRAAAIQESLERFGDPIEVAEMLSTVHRRRLPRVRMVLGTVLLLAGLSGVFGAAGTFAFSPRHHGAPATKVHLRERRYVIDEIHLERTREHSS